MKVTAYLLAHLDKVQSLLGEGWQPWGAPIAVRNFQNFDYVWQAMVQYQESPIQDMGPK